MRVLEFAHSKRVSHKRWQDTKLEHSVYSKEDCDLKFTYQKGSETRGIWLEIDREEAKQLLEFLNEFLTDEWGA